MTLDTAPITIRLATTDDDQALVRLSALDSSQAPDKPVLLAEVDGELRAALSLHNGAVVADPFFLTEDLVTLLRARVNSGARRRRAPRPRYRLGYA